MTDRWTWHGGGLRAAQAQFGTRDLPWIDLSTGINPHPWPVLVDSFDWARLPDEQDLRDLEAAAAAHFGTLPACVCAVPGTEIGLRMVGSLIDGPAFHALPSYRTHGEMLDGSLPVTDLRLADADGATLILANPNNPDGRLRNRAELLDLLDRRGRTGWLLIDEAFADAHRHASLADQVGEDRRLMIFRSFGKFFGLAGVRLGFVLGPPSFLAVLRRKLGAWPLSASAIAIGTAAYRDHDWIAQTRVHLMAQADALDAVLNKAGLHPQGACPLFRLVETDDARALFDRLAARFILTRPFTDNPQWLRFGLPADSVALARLKDALGVG